MRMSKSVKKKLEPSLRFPEFKNDIEWDNPSLSEIADRIEEKVGERKLTTVSISAGIGFVSQAEKFSRDISGQQYKNYIFIKAGDFSYNKGNSKKYPQGCIYKLKEYSEAAVPNAFVSFRFKNKVVPEFYEGYFESNFHGPQLQKFISSGARMDGLLNISPTDFFTIKFPTPKNKKEQQKIADCLSSLDELIIAENQKLEALQLHKKGLMQQLFPAAGDASTGSALPKLRFKEFKDSGEWEEIELGQLGELVSGLTYSPEDVRDDGLLVLRSSNIKDSKIVLEDCVFVTSEIKGANLTKPNDILICVRNGSKSLIGKNALVPEGMPLSTHGAFMTVFRASNPEFVFQLFQSDLFKRQVDADLGATINSINGSQLVKYKFTCPKPKEQKRLADFLSSVDELIQSQGVKVEILKAHKKGLMQQLFPTSIEN